MCKRGSRVIYANLKQKHNQANQDGIFPEESGRGLIGVMPVVTGQRAKLDLDFIAKSPHSRISSG